MARGGNRIGGRGSRHGRGSRNGQHGLFGGIPDTSGSLLSEFTSWNTFSAGASRGYDYIRRLSQQRDSFFQIAAQQDLARRAKAYGNLHAGLGGFVGRVSGTSGTSLDALMRRFFLRVEKAGGVSIANDELAGSLKELRTSLSPIIQSTSGVEGEILKSLVRSLETAEKNAGTGGLTALGGSRDILRSAFDLKADNAIDAALKNLGHGITDATTAISDPALQTALTDVRTGMESAAAAAKDAAEKQAAVADAAQKLQRIAGTASGNDRQVVDKLSESARVASEGLATELKSQAKDRNRQTGRFNAIVGNVFSSLGNGLRYLVPLKRTLDVGNAIFQAVNSKVNQFGRMQIGVSAERGALGRIIRGAGINFSNMMSAIGTGRRAGMDDREVVNQMASMQEQLARARWGEGPLIENLGKWGLTPFDENGNMKDFHQVMIDISRKFNTLGSDAERLQFLSMQGFRADQMQYVRDYERDAARWEEIKRNPRRQGVLESARILDESGLSARIDAATKIELKRRQILNQNAIDEGIWEGVKRSFHPDNWLFSDWTARQRGVAQAKSDVAQEHLEKALRELQATVKANKVAVDKNSTALNSLSAEDLVNLSYTSGWAQQDIANFGSKSQVYALSKDFAQKVGGRSPLEAERLNKKTSAWIGAGVGAAIGAGLLAALAPVTGGTSLLAAAALVGGGAYVGANVGYQNPAGIYSSGGAELRDKLRRAQNDEEVKELLRGTGIELDIAQVKSREFQLDDEKAFQMMQGGHFANINRQVQERLRNGKIVDPFAPFSNKYTEAVVRKRGRDLSAEEMVTAKAYNLDPSYNKIHDEWYANYVEDMISPESSKYKDELAKQKAKVLKEHPNWEWDSAEVGEIAQARTRKSLMQTLSAEEKQGYIRHTAYWKGRNQLSNEEQRKEIAEMANLEAAIGQYDLMELVTKPTDPSQISWAEGWQHTIYDDTAKSTIGQGNWLLAPVIGFGMGMAHTFVGDSMVAKSNELRANQARRLRELRKKYEGRSAADLEKERLEEEKMTGLSQEEKERAIIKKLYGKGGELHGQKRKFSEMFEWEKKEAVGKLDFTIGSKEPDFDEEEVKQKAQAAYEQVKEKYTGKPEDVEYMAKRAYDNTVKTARRKVARDKRIRRQQIALLGDLGGGLSAENKLSLMTIEGKQKYSMTRDEIANYQLTDEEVDNIETRLAKGEKLEESLQGRYDIWKLGSKYREREKAKADKLDRERRKKEDEEAKAKAALAVESDVKKYFGEGANNTMWKPSGEGGTPTAHDLMVLRTARARGYSLTDAQQKILEKADEERKGVYEAAGLSKDVAYDVFSALENKELQGVKLSDSQVSFIKEARKKIQGNPQRKRQAIPLHQEPVKTEEEIKDEAHIKATIERLKKTRATKETQKSVGEYHTLAEETQVGRQGIPSDQVDATATFRAHEEQIAQASNKIANAVNAAEGAAATANTLGAVASPDSLGKNVTINLGGQTITQNIQGEYPMDQDGMKRGTLQGSADIRDKTAEALVAVTMNKGSY